MIAAAILGILALLTGADAVFAVDAAWASPLNSALLIVLTMITYKEGRAAHAERKEVASKVAVVADKLQRPPTARTRVTDMAAEMAQAGSIAEHIVTDPSILALIRKDGPKLEKLVG